MKSYWKKIIDQYLILLLFIILVVFVWQKYFNKGSTFLIPAIFMPTTTSLENANIDTSFHFSIKPLYLQNDPRWKNDKMGGSEETLGKAGCFVSCISMALAHHGIDLLPNQLNELLKNNNGYTKQGWVKWYSVSKITNHKIRFQASNQPNFTQINTALKAREPVLAKIQLYGIFPHWVLIVGKEKQDYFVKDPLGDGKSLDKLSTFKSKIYAIRIVKKME